MAEQPDQGNSLALWSLTLAFTAAVIIVIVALMFALTSGPN